jgi:hypothetical protein
LAQEEEHLPSKPEALSSKPKTVKKSYHMTLQFHFKYIPKRTSNTCPYKNLYKEFIELFKIAKKCKPKHPSTDGYTKCSTFAQQHITHPVDIVQW